LMDGIDGLAGIIFSIGFLILIALAAFMKNYEAVLFFIPFFGAIIAFLRFNLSTKKIFIGDAGTLFVGTLLIGSSIYMLNQSVGTTQSAHLVVIHLFIGFFSLPVLDSLRVYLGRMKKGQSAFKADKTHLHHLILLFNRSHKKTALIISFIILLFLLTAFIGAYFITLSTYFFLILMGFSFLAYLLNLNQKVLYWQQKMHEIENNSTSSLTI
jgi:UDP-GlcNAc:undecaprenyl-phosphate GlcNAc-1-phosphate transferase